MSRRSAPIHSASCSVWDPPADSMPEALVATGCSNEAHAAYLCAARPIYDGLKRCVGQIGGVLLLIQAKGLDRMRRDVLVTAIRDQLKELRERMRAFPVPQGARAHHESLQRLLGLLGSVYSHIDRAADLLDPDSADLSDAIATLFACHGGLLAAAVPRAGLMPVDFAAACCNCRQLRRRTGTS